MVDAINSKPITSPKDIAINWKQCTADEIMDYQGQGQDVPTQFLRWAQDMAAVANAPDDVTYEMANSPDQLAEQEQEALNVAQLQRQQMNENGIGLKEQGQTFTSDSRQAQTDTLAMISTMDNATARSEAIANEAAAKTAQTVETTQSIKAEYDKLVERSKSETAEQLTPSEKQRLVTLGQQLNKFGTNAQNELQNMGIELAALDVTINQGTAISQNATNYGVETVDIGLQLIGADSNTRATANADGAAAAGTKGGSFDAIKNTIGNFNFFEMKFNSNYRVGAGAITQGASTLDSGADGTSKTETTLAANNANKNQVNNNKTKIQNATLVGPKESSDSGNTDKPEETDTPTGEEDPTLADTAITTDPNEILKRKERKGIV